VTYVSPVLVAASNIYRSSAHALPKQHAGAKRKHCVFHLLRGLETHRDPTAPFKTCGFPRMTRGSSYWFGLLVRCNLHLSVHHRFAGFGF